MLDASFVYWFIIFHKIGKIKTVKFLSLVSKVYRVVKSKTRQQLCGQGSPNQGNVIRELSAYFINGWLLSLVRLRLGSSWCVFHNVKTNGLHCAKILLCVQHLIVSSDINFVRGLP